jgi:hypothetical protein
MVAQMISRIVRRMARPMVVLVALAVGFAAPGASSAGSMFTVAPNAEALQSSNKARGCISFYECWCLTLDCDPIIDFMIYGCCCICSPPICGPDPE